MNDGSIMLKKINILGSKANELINTNKLLSNKISYYQNIFNSNKNYIMSYFNILAENKKKSKNNNNTNNKINHINNIKELIIKYHSEIKDLHLTSTQNLKLTQQKNNTFLTKLNSETKKLSDYYQKISEDNFLYANAIQSKENFISCLRKDLFNLKNKLFEDEKHIYLKYNYQNIYTTYKTTTTQTQSNINGNENMSFEEGENEIKELLIEERRKFIINMKSRSNIRLKYTKMNVKKNALNDLVTSISFINKTDILPSKSNNIFQVLNKKIGGVIRNYEKYFDDNNEIIDEHYFIFLPFELEINKDEINELVQTDITLPNVKLQSKSINEYKKSSKKVTKNRSFIDVPKLNFLQIEFNKEKISYSDTESDKIDDKKSTQKIKSTKNNEKDNDNEKINDNKKEINNDKDNDNKNENIDEKIKRLKKNIHQLKKDNKKLKRLINDFEMFQKKIENKFVIYEKMILNKKQENNDNINIKVDVNDIKEN